jgi:hypothetical protein
MSEKNKNTYTPETTNELSGLPYTHCLNCGTELKGQYCHSCGQEAVSKTPTVKSFVLAYLDNAFLWDSKFVKTFWTLIRRPGQLTNEFNAGKFLSQEHPLKLNMFLLFIFVTLFVFFASADKMTDSVYNITYDERVFSSVQLQSLLKNPEYVKKFEENRRDTVLLQAPLFLAESYPQIISNIETKEDTKGEALDKWVAVIPHVFIEEEVVVVDENGYYHFNTEAKIGTDELEIFNSIGAEMIRITSQYFPMLLLLTVPFLTFSLRVVQRKRKIPGINHFIFALHYTALLETLMIVVYILHLAIDMPIEILEYSIIISSITYLTIAFHRVYPSSWGKAIAKSILTNLIYTIILILIFMAIFIIACIIIAINMI